MLLAAADCITFSTIELLFPHDKFLIHSSLTRVTGTRIDSPMKEGNVMRRMTATSITLALVAIVGAFAMSGSTIRAQDPPQRSLVGVWLTEVTRRSCDTGDPIATSRTQVTFAEGGTLLETIGPSVSRSPGNGIWKREQGWNEYSFTLRFMRYDAFGSFVGSGVVRATLTLDETGDHYTSTTTNDVLDVNGNVVGRGCATSESTRFQ